VKHIYYTSNRSWSTRVRFLHSWAGKLTIEMLCTAATSRIGQLQIGWHRIFIIWIVSVLLNSLSTINHLNSQLHLYSHICDIYDESILDRGAPYLHHLNSQRAILNSLYTLQHLNRQFHLSSHSCDIYKRLQPILQIRWHKLFIIFIVSLVHTVCERACVRVQVRTAPLL